ncbi:MULTISPECIES: DUF61 family protein [unclassified Methanoregula]|uniref:DUF61 family protein n=1 Tax=unclassified Methanoregula TaxID=2649730 RepID=UPI0009C7E86D|nr:MULTISPECIES: DUF61 family protein [unclassified Methanoregula]OPX62531.1 MAG: hypothetical protein A4E33_02280 [Methanoregula sp. PtaB.Bin085]OPY31630.1 MAG: hypothetical protein A4E34_02823 [Methanoregula sp. PtaU1.Bin006]
MTYAPRITDESVLQRWIGIEVKKMNQGIVKERKRLAALLAEETPQSVTKGDEPYYFDRAVLDVLAKGLPEDLHRRLRLPVFFYASPDTPDSCSCPDDAALEALQKLGEVSTLRTMQGDRFWVSKPIAYALLQKYPTAVQIVMGV